jgi:hypothetical protein
VLESEDIARLADLAAFDSLTGLEHIMTAAADTEITLRSECHNLTSPCYFYSLIPPAAASGHASSVAGFILK